MRIASIVLDIPTRALESAYSYRVPSELDATALVGATVLVDFSHRAAVGYIVSVGEQPDQALDLDKLKPIQQVLAPPAFDERAANVIAWISREYACPLSEAVRPFLAPGQKVKVERADDNSPWELVSERAGAVDDRWVELVDQAYEPPATASRQRQVIEALSAGPMRVAELTALIGASGSAVKSLEKRAVVRCYNRRRVRGGEATTLSSARATRPEHLTEGQRNALAAIDEAVARGCGDVVLVDGVTGSGKTEVYLEAIERVLAQGEGALVLVPEISLTAQTVGRFRSRFGDDVAILHSRLSTGERFDQWDLVRQGLAHVVVGARSALFAPLSNVGLIIIDEEHEGSYKQDQAPRYHARELAARLAAERGAALVLGSATPSLEALERCRVGSHAGARWTRVEMPERPGNATLPKVTVVDMAAGFRAGSRSIFSAELVAALKGIAERREKAVLLLNRRGFATFLMCRDCGCVPECPHCSTSLTYHERSHSLMCHTCGQSWPIKAYPDPSTRCPNCGSRFLAAFGVGTQRVEDELRLLLPETVEVIRMDADTTRTKGAHQELLERFDAAECAVLIGTQMIAKGLDFPEVTLVGVINADTMLKLPDFRAAERTYDLLEQVSGRAGRGDTPGQVIVQTWWASHPAITSAARHDRDPFLASELAERREAGYPPFSRLANVTFWGRQAREVEQLADAFAADLRSRVEGAAGWEVLGPADCVKARVKDRYRRHILIKAPLDADVGVILSECARTLPARRGSNMSIDIDAYDLM